MARYMPKDATDLERFMARVCKTEGCWEWIGYRDRDGYGTLTIGGKTRRAHRFLYEHFVGPIPDGMELDHIRCDNPSCVNPEHLQPATNEANLFRSSGPASRNRAVTACKRGHPFDEQNTRVTRDGKRRCRTCHRDEVRSAARRSASVRVGPLT